MMSNSKKVMILSALSLAAAVLLLGYSAYGWMTMSKSVRAVGQDVQVSVPDDLLISLSENGPWSESVNVKMDDLVRELTKDDSEKFTEGRYFLLPASTYDACNNTFWQTESAKADGSAADNAVFEAGHRILWNPNTTAFEGHWIDVPLYFMTDSETDIDVALSEEGTFITPVGGADESITKTVRAAFLNETGTKNASDAEDPLVFAGNNSTGVFGGEVIQTATTKIAPKYLAFSDAKSEKLFTVKAGREVKSIIVRIWVEGQDQNCVARIGGQTFSLTLKFVPLNDDIRED